MNAAQRVATPSLRQWLEERQHNAERIASTKRGADREGWLEDADYFRRAASAVAQLEPVAQPPQELTHERILQLWRDTSKTFNEDRHISPVHLFAHAVWREASIAAWREHGPKSNSAKDN